MRTIRKTIFMAFLLALVTAGMATSGMAQFGTNDAAIRDLVRRIQTRTDSLQRAVQNAADRNNSRTRPISSIAASVHAARVRRTRKCSSIAAHRSIISFQITGLEPARGVSGRRYAPISISSQTITT